MYTTRDARSISNAANAGHHRQGESADDRSSAARLRWYAILIRSTTSETNHCSTSCTSCLGNMYDAQHPDRLNENGITHIINATPDLPLRTESKYTCLRIPVLDAPSQMIRDHFELVADFLGAFVVLVQCTVHLRSYSCFRQRSSFEDEQSSRSLLGRHQP